jgi:hypothetical protein
MGRLFLPLKAANSSERHIMAMIGRIILLSVLAGGLGAGLGFVLFRQYGDCGIPCFLLGCVGGIVGAIAGAGREIASALRQRPTE